MLLDVVAKADTLVGPQEGTAAGSQGQRLKQSCVGTLGVCVCVCVSSLTRLPGPAEDGCAPGPRADAVEGLDADLVLGPLLQVLDGELPLQAVGDDMGQNTSRGASFEVLDPVAHQLRVPIVLPLRKRLQKQQGSVM